MHRLQQSKPDQLGSRAVTYTLTYPRRRPSGPVAPTQLQGTAESLVCHQVSPAMGDLYDRLVCASVVVRRELVDVVNLMPSAVR